MRYLSEFGLLLLESVKKIDQQIYDHFCVVIRGLNLDARIAR